MPIEVEKADVGEIARKHAKTEAEVMETVETVKRAMEPRSKRIPIVEDGVRKYYAVERRGIGILNTQYGKFWEYEFAVDDTWETYSVIVKADCIDHQSFKPQFKDQDNLVLRIDSGCKTGQVLEI